VSRSNLLGVARASGADIWGYGRYGDDQLLPLSFDDVRHDTAAAVSALMALHLPDRSIVVLTSTVADVGYFHPIQSAAKELGLVVCNADASAMDVDRVAMFIRLLPVAAIVGVNDAMIDGLADGGHDPNAFFCGIPVVIANRSAQGRLTDAGVDVVPFEILGPALAFPCRHRRLHFDGRTWSIDGSQGTLHVSSRRPRALSVDHFDTRLVGSVSDDLCPCGRRDPVISLGPEGEPA
jgi:hypothetical protein